MNYAHLNKPIPLLDTAKCQLACFYTGEGWVKQFQIPSSGNFLKLFLPAFNEIYPFHFFNGEISINYYSHYIERFMWDYHMWWELCTYHGFPLLSCRYLVPQSESVSCVLQIWKGLFTTGRTRKFYFCFSRGWNDPLIKIKSVLLRSYYTASGFISAQPFYKLKSRRLALPLKILPLTFLSFSSNSFIFEITTP